MTMQAHTKLNLFGSENNNCAVKYAADHSLKLHPTIMKLAEVTNEQPMSLMMASLDEIQFFQNIVRCIGAKKTLDIGVFTGISALGVALALPEDGKVIACDISDENAKLGFPFWKEAGVDEKIEFVQAPALDTLKKLLEKGEGESFDFAFIDADKDNYENYFEMCLKLVRKNGIIAIDNTIWSGRVYDKDANDEATVAIRNFNKKIYKDERVYLSFLTLGDGTTLAFKK